MAFQGVKPSDAPSAEVFNFCNHSQLAAAQEPIHWPSETWKLDKGLQQAIKQYEQGCISGCDGGPYLICNYVRFSIFKSWYEGKENCWRIAFQYTDSMGGCALLFGDPSKPHNLVAGWFITSIIESIYSCVGHAGDYTALTGSSGILLTNGWLKEPDFSLVPYGWPESHPALMGEVAYLNENLEVLKKELALWGMRSSAKVIYGVKISQAEGVKLWFLESRGGILVREIDFSPGVCTSAGDPAFIVPLPLKDLFENCEDNEKNERSSRQKLLEETVLFDLFQLQKMIMYWVNQWPPVVATSSHFPAPASFLRRGIKLRSPLKWLKAFKSIGRKNL